MSKHVLLAPVVCSLVVAVSCAKGLTHDEAKTVIERNPLIRSTDAVSVDAISSTGSADAVVRATIGAHTTNLKFRRFDTGWTWEFVETKTGGWIAPDVAIGEFREATRTVASTAWATQHMADYEVTAYTISLMALYNVPNPTALARPDIWEKMQKMRPSIADSFRSRTDMDAKEREARIAVLTNDHQFDAWGNEIQAVVDKNSGAIVIVSAGADKTNGTDDDIRCENTFTSGFEDGRSIWNHHRTWSVPEGLGSAITNKFFDKRTDRIEYTRIVKP